MGMNSFNANRGSVTLDAVLNTVCTKCGGSGHISSECFNSNGQKYELIEEPGVVGTGADDEDWTKGVVTTARKQPPNSVGRGRASTMPAWMKDPMLAGGISNVDSGNISSSRSSSSSNKLYDHHHHKSEKKKEKDEKKMLKKIRKQQQREMKKANKKGKGKDKDKDKKKKKEKQIKQRKDKLDVIDDESSSSSSSSDSADNED